MTEIWKIQEYLIIFPKGQDVIHMSLNFNRLLNSELTIIICLSITRKKVFPQISRFPNSNKPNRKIWIGSILALLVVQPQLDTTRARSTGERRVFVTGTVTAVFSHVTLVEKDGQPPVAHS